MTVFMSMMWYSQCYWILKFTSVMIGTVTEFDLLTAYFCWTEALGSYPFIDL